MVLCGITSSWACWQQATRPWLPSSPIVASKPTGGAAMGILVAIISLVCQRKNQCRLVVISLDNGMPEHKRKGHAALAARPLVPSNADGGRLVMDRLKKTRYDVKHCARSGVRQIRRGQIGESPTVKLGSKRHVGGRETPELICECNTIPFAHFLFQCVDVRRDEANDAIAHVPAASEPPLL